MPLPQHSVCVYCGARSGTDPAYAEAAGATGRMLAEEGWGLVYGAGDIGLMGTVARAARMAGARTLGVIPGHLMAIEVGSRDLDTLIVTETMHERKKVMFMNAAAVAVLPGGGGSLDEFFEVLTWRQLGLHEKPILLLDVNGYWQPLVSLIRHIVAQGFAEPSLLDFYRTVPGVEELRAELRRALA